LDINARFHAAVQSFWDARNRQQQKQIESGKIDAGTRGAVTGGSQMRALEELVSDVLCAAGLEDISIKTKLGLELPGYFRPEKKWDLIVVSKGQLVCALEFKSQVGPSFGNNFNNRSEEAIGNAVDIWTAFREGRFLASPRPLIGYFFLLEDCASFCSKTATRFISRSACKSLTSRPIPILRTQATRSDMSCSADAWYWSGITTLRASRFRPTPHQRESRTPVTT